VDHGDRAIGPCNPIDASALMDVVGSDLHGNLNSKGVQI
jgi:hypothetical protein